MSKFILSYQRDMAPPDAPEVQTAALRAPRPSGTQGPPSFDNYEGAARYHLSRHLARDSRPALRSLATAQDSGLTRHLRTTDSQASPLTDTHLVSFTQTRAIIPIFGYLA